MAKYRRLNVLEREEISRSIAVGDSLRKVARTLQRHPSTISRELNRCVFDLRYYRAFSAQQRSNKVLHQHHKTGKLDKNPVLRKVVLEYLAKKWSPEQIAKRLVILYPDDMTMRVSHETIYKYVYVLPRGELKRELAA